MTSQADIVVGGGAAGCFSPDTLILTDSGYKAISDVKVGDKVLSNDTKGKESYKRVLEKFKRGGAHLSQKLCIFNLSNGEQIKCTPDHEIYFEGTWHNAQYIARRILERGTQHRRDLLHIHPRKITNEELEKCGEGCHNETGTGCERVLANDDQKKWEVGHDKSSQVSGTGIYSKSRKQASGKSQGLQSGKQPHIEPGMGYSKGELPLFETSNGRLHLGESTRNYYEGFTQRNGFTNGGKGQGYSKEVYPNDLYQKDVSPGIRGFSCYNKRCSTATTLEACLINSVEIKYYTGYVYDLCVEGFHTYCVTTQNIIVHNSGKSFVLLLDALRNVHVKDYGAMIFRKTYPEIMNEGGLWDESKKLYYHRRGVPVQSKALWTFPKKTKVKFSHLQHDKNLASFQGAQIPMIGFDELTHFSRYSFFYMLTRNRSMSGVHPRMRTTCNPDPDSFVADLISWWIDEDSGFPIYERGGQVRYFFSNQDQPIWGDSKEEVIAKAGDLLESDDFQGIDKRHLIKSFTFIPGRISDNQILLQQDPGYLANLMSQDEETQMRLLKGNWKIRTDGTSIFGFQQVKDMFTNLVKTHGETRWIVIDHARFGKDLCVIGTWWGMACKRIDILYSSDTNDIMKVIQPIRMEMGIPASQVIIDQDGTGVVDRIQCRIFQGASTAIDQGKEKQFYQNLITQCYYKMGEAVNDNLVSLDLDNVWLWENGRKRKVHEMQLRGKPIGIKKMIEDDLRTVKRENPDLDQRKKMTPKDVRKEVLGRSPDMGDMIAMRYFGELVRLPQMPKKL